MNSEFKIIFVHGYTSSHLADWYPTISTELDKLGWDYVIPDLPGYKHPKAEEWLSVIHKTVKESDKPLVFVGHSLGTRAVLLYLEKYTPKVKKVFLIAAFANRLENAQRRGGVAYPDFFAHKLPIQEIKTCAEEFIVVHSTDDTSIPYEQGEEIANDLGATLINFDNRNHFVEPENASYILDILRCELS